MEINITDDTRPVNTYFITIIRDRLLDLLSRNVIQIAENVEIYLGKKYATTVLMNESLLCGSYLKK